MKRFEARGASNLLRQEKAQLTAFVRGFLVEKDRANDRAISIFRSQGYKKETPLKIQAENVRVQQSLGNPENESGKKQSQSQIKLWGENLKQNNLSINLSEMEIPEKYLEHLAWLEENVSDRQFVDNFRALLMAAYQAPSEKN